jgi:hypothetical protein
MPGPMGSGRNAAAVPQPKAAVGSGADALALSGADHCTTCAHPTSPLTPTRGIWVLAD